MNRDPESNQLPPELRALKGAMEMVFGAVIAAPRGLQPIVAGVNPDPAGAAPDFNAVTNAAPGGGSQPVDREHEGAVHLAPSQIPAVPVAAPRRMDIENEIMRAPGFDYLLASEIFAALQRRLELRYENLNPQVEEAMQRLAKSFDHVTG